MQLLQVVPAGVAARGLSRALYSRQEKRDQGSNDRDYDEKLDKRKAFGPSPHGRALPKELWQAGFVPVRIAGPSWFGNFALIIAAKFPAERAGL
jgi:hypothetical protein